MLHFPGRSDVVNVHGSSLLGKTIASQAVYASHGIRSSQDYQTKKRMGVAWDLTRVPPLALALGCCGPLDVQVRLLWAG